MDAELKGLFDQILGAIADAREAANRSVLDGTVSCQNCRALILESNAPGHYAWHFTQGESVNEYLLEEA